MFKICRGFGFIGLGWIGWISICSIYPSI
jgi:TM2 domain-containing membrane protein YozV